MDIFHNDIFATPTVGATHYYNPTLQLVKSLVSMLSIDFIYGIVSTSLPHLRG
jgi:hypothetical protein